MWRDKNKLCGNIGLILKYHGSRQGIDSWFSKRKFPVEAAEIIQIS